MYENEETADEQGASTEMTAGEGIPRLSKVFVGKVMKRSRVMEVAVWGFGMRGKVLTSKLRAEAVLS